MIFFKELASLVVFFCLFVFSSLFFPIFWFGNRPKKNRDFLLGPYLVLQVLQVLYWKNSGENLLWQFVAKTFSLEYIGGCLSHLQDNCVEFYSRTVILPAIFQAG